jgi:hypothetical protein
LPDDVYAEPALHDNALPVVDDANLVRASLDAVLAPYASVPVNSHDAFRSGIDGCRGTDSLTGRSFAVVALNWNELL